MSLSPDQIRHIARLARISIEPAEGEAVREELNRVLELVDAMQKVDTTGVVPMAHALEAQVPGGQRLRPDEVTERDRRADFQALAPAVERDLYLVPKVIE
ncbi:MAG: Asp-tRNA(Asn)/Glu-tRNA(Gln) amidotransferase subunit GatC [Burkholderiales bacterium]